MSDNQRMKVSSLRLGGRMEEWLLFVNKIIIRPDRVLMIHHNDTATPPTLQYQVLMSVRGQPSAPAITQTAYLDVLGSIQISKKSLLHNAEKKYKY